MNTIIKTLAAALLAGISSIAFAQNAHETRVKFNKEDQNAIVAEYDVPRGVLEDALKERLEKAGLGRKGSEKGFISYKAAVWAEIGPDKVDVYARVDGKGDKSTITVLVSKGYTNFITSASDADKVQRIQNFLNNFAKDAKAYQLRLAIAAQEEVAAQAAKEVKNSADDGEKLNREREKIEKQIAENKNEQSKKQSIADAESKKLQDLKAQIMQ